MRPKSALAFVLSLLLLRTSPLLAAAAPARVDVILWFDTEDYLLPADDDACLRLADLLSARGIRATFKVVGEKARVLEHRGRHDVIAALSRHAIGFHANYHSVHPTPSEYLADCGWLDGVAEFARREGPGAADVRRIFSVPLLACYGQPGSSWASQAIGALPEIGVAPCYVDEGEHVGLDGQPFWFAGAVNVFHMGENYTRMELHDPAAVTPAKERVQAIADRLRRKPNGGMISIFYHPCEWVHQEFWDGVNFRRGANPPREQWRPPPQRTPAETDAAFQRFGDYIDFIRSLPGVRFVTAADLPAIYPDPLRVEGARETDLSGLSTVLAAEGAKGLDFQIIDHRAFSAADQFELYAFVINRLIAGQTLEFPIKLPGILGPDSQPPAPREGVPLAWPALRDATRDVCDFLQTQHRVPSRVFIGSSSIPPADFLLLLAAAYDSWRKTGAWPRDGQLSTGAHPALLSARYVASDSAELFGGWIIHPEGFRAPKILDVARLQSWTLKPAIRANGPPLTEPH